MQAAPGLPRQPSSSLQPPSSPLSTDHVASSAHPALASGDLATFLQPSFDAAAYVSQLISGVDAQLGVARSTAQPPTPSAKLAVSPGGLLQPASPGILPASAQNAAGSRTSISLASPSAAATTADAAAPTADAAAGSSKAQAAQRKREQDQEEVDLSLAISRLNLAIEELDRSISTQVTANAPALLQRTSRLATMQHGLEQTKQGVESLDIEVASLRRKVHDPFQRLTELQADLRMYDGAGELVAKAVKFVGLARRLETQMEALFAKKDGTATGKAAEADGEDAVVGLVHGRDLSRAALLIHEISDMLDAERPQGSDGLLALKLVQDVVPVVESARKTVVDYMEDMIVRGLRDLSPVMLASSLQTAFNLGTLPTLVKDLLDDLTEVVRERTAAALDLDAIARQLGLAIPSLEASNPSYSTYRGGRRRDDASARQQQQQAWSDALWKRLESLIVVEMGAVCSKVYLLEKVLKLKTDAETGVNFLAAALDVLGDKPSHTFWRTLAQCLEQQTGVATAKSPWVAQLLSSGIAAENTQGGVVMGGYMRLLRLLHEFFAKITVYTDVQYTQTHQSAETVILLCGLAPLEKGYVDKATWRVAEVLSQVVAPTRRTALDASREADGVVALVANAVDGVRSDPLLLRAVVDRCTALVEQYATRLDKVVAEDASAWLVDGRAVEASASQTWNAALVRFSHALAAGLTGAAAEQDAASASYAATRLHAAVDTIIGATRRVLLDPLVRAAEQTVAERMGKMHVQLASRGAVHQRGVSIDATSGASAYISDVCDALAFLRDHLLPLYPPQLRISLAGAVPAAAAHCFLLYAGLLALPEQADKVKLRLATDMTELEFALTQLVGEAPKQPQGGKWVDDAERAEVVGNMKVFRRTLFMDTHQLVEEAKGVKPNSVFAVAMALHLVSRAGALDKVLAATARATKSSDAAARSELVRSAMHSTTGLIGRIHSALPNASLDDETTRIINLLLPPTSA
ncbi:uncharacterized protein PSANT_03393 [Moesziomyces antarcticus]|uniref:Conserved oligomeric Golgi complex subunit 5 n=1 Tax=Pseudozyma antarctica TaxID=84753 RepID=A0A5C3FQA8_PSEA2|nr:uncharacterized protein PSANT_03393 [Moesziomyces antarcticus]